MTPTLRKNRVQYCMTPLLLLGYTSSTNAGPHRPIKALNCRLGPGLGFHWRLSTKPQHTARLSCPPRSSPLKDVTTQAPANYLTDHLVSFPAVGLADFTQQQGAVSGKDEPKGWWLSPSMLLEESTHYVSLVLNKNGLSMKYESDESNLEKTLLITPPRAISIPMI